MSLLREEGLAILHDSRIGKRANKPQIQYPAHSARGSVNHCWAELRDGEDVDPLHGSLEIATDKQIRDITNLLNKRAKAALASSNL